MAITPLPTLDRTSVNFKANVDTFFGSQLPTFSVEAEAARVEVVARQGQAATSAENAATSEGNALGSKNSATLSAENADTSAGNAATAKNLAEAAAASITAQVAVATHAAASKAVPVDADEFPLADSAASFGLKRLTWAAMKAMFAALFPTKGGVQAQTHTAYRTTGTNTSYAITPAPALGAYATFASFTIELHTLSGANPTLNISSLGALSLVRRLQSGAYVNYSTIPAGIYRITLISPTLALVENPALLITGTVSQTGDVPTGAIVESGSNADGSWTKWAGGKMICTHRQTVSASISNSFQGAFHSGGLNWLFPQPFLTGTAPNSSVQPYALSATGAQVSATPTNTGLSYVVFSNAAQPGAVRYIELRAEGVWS